MTARTTARRPLAPALSLVLGAGALLALVASTPAEAGSRPAYLPPVGHVFVINIENKGYDTTWGPDSPAPYLSQTLRAKGVLLNTYYGTAHNSQPNYVAQLSGQGPNPQMQGDCQVYSSFLGLGTVAGKTQPSPRYCPGLTVPRPRKEE